MKRTRFLLYILPMLLVACKPSGTGERGEGTRHYDVEYNFLVTADSLVLQEERPMHTLITPDTSDSMAVRRGDPLVVAQIEVIPEDSLDSVWVKVARDQQTQGWVHESALLRSVVPDDPISQGIGLFSDRHTIVALGLCLFVFIALLLRHRPFAGDPGWTFVHLRDIPSPYPTLLCLGWAAATVLYTTIQMFVPDLWAEFYYHPTLNPFGQPTLLALFLGLAWAIVILFIASADDLRRCLPAPGILLYTLSLLAFLGMLYLLFSIATQYFLGYFLLMLYVALAVGRYWRCHRPRYRCGKCRAPLHERGRCPKCGTINN